MAELDGVKILEEDFVGMNHSMQRDADRIHHLENKLIEAEALILEIKEYRDHISDIGFYLEEINGGLVVEEGISKLGDLAGAERLHARILRNVVGKLHGTERYKPEMVMDDEA
jgi:hypothetical protein